MLIDSERPRNIRNLAARPADPSASPRLVEPRTPQLQYDVEHHGDDLIILTNADGAEDFKIVTAPVATSAPDSLDRILSPHRPGTIILSMVALAGLPVRLEREDANAAHRACATSRTGGEAVDRIRRGGVFARPPRQATNSTRTDPLSLFVDDHAERSDRTTTCGPANVFCGSARKSPAGTIPTDYVTRRLFAAAPDGEQVPISLVHRRDIALDGSAPCLLYGYGSYGMPCRRLQDQRAVIGRPGLRLCDRPYPRRHREGLALVLDGKRENKPNTSRISSPADGP